MHQLKHQLKQDAYASALQADANALHTLLQQCCTLPCNAVAMLLMLFEFEAIHL